MRVYQKLTPLTQEEQKFAEENHWVIDWFFRISNYNLSEYYDVAAIGYLKAVKSWHTRSELHEYSFSTIAKQTMRSYIGNELKKADRRIKTISLDAIVGDSEGMTLMDMVTYDSYLNCYSLCVGGGVKTQALSKGA